MLLKLLSKGLFWTLYHKCNGATSDQLTIPLNKSPCHQKWKANIHFPVRNQSARSYIEKPAHTKCCWQNWQTKDKNFLLADVHTFARQTESQYNRNIHTTISTNHKIDLKFWLMSYFVIGWNSCRRSTFQSHWQTVVRKYGYGS